MPLKIEVPKSDRTRWTTNRGAPVPNIHRHHHKSHDQGDGEDGGGSGRQQSMPPTGRDGVPGSPLVRKSRAAGFRRYSSHAGDELRNFRSWLRWMCVDQTATWTAVVSWIVFLTLGIFVPAVSHFVLSYSEKRRTFDTVVEASLTAAATLSFLCLTTFVRRYGLRRFLFLDKLCGVSERVRLGYTAQLNSSFKLLALFVVPCFLAETVYRIWWYCVGVGRIPFLANPIASHAIACTLELLSWLYRTSIFLLVCVLFHLACHLQILRLQDFAAVFLEESDVGFVLFEHLRIRRQLRIISHRFRFFIVASLLLVSFSQLFALLLTIRPHAEVSFFNASELALCSIGLVSGLVICLRSAAKITHKAQAITSHAAKWHVCATIDSFESDPETSSTGFSGLVFPTDDPFDPSDDEAEDTNDLNDMMLLQPHAQTISFQKRQAFVTYLKNNRAGITVYGFMLDRAWLHTIFAMELTLFLRLLQKTAGFP